MIGDRPVIIWLPSDRRAIRAFVGRPGVVVRLLVGTWAGLVLLGLLMATMAALGVRAAVNGDLPTEFLQVGLGGYGAYRLNSALRKLLAFDPCFFERSLEEQTEFAFRDFD